MLAQLTGMTSSDMSSSPFRRIGVLVFGWLIVALVVGATGLLGRSPLPPPGVALILTAAILLIIWLSPGAREAVRGIGIAPLVAFHLIRILAGAYFLVLYENGALPGAFAIPAGWGDIAVGLTALLVLKWCIPLRSRRQRAGLLVWNAAGLIDIVGVLANGARLLLGDPGIGRLFEALPLALLPTFVVPIVLVSHVLLFAWARPHQA